MSQQAATDPFAKYGGQAVATAPPAATDPFAKYGGQIASAPSVSPPAPAATTDTSSSYTMADAAKEAWHGATDPIVGALDAAGETGVGLLKLAHKVPGVGYVMDHAGHMMENIQQNDERHAALQGEVDADPMGRLGVTGGRAMETVLEFMSGEEALKGLSLGAKLGKIAPVMQLMEKYPRMAAAMLTGMRQGTVGAGQAIAHGADTGEALTTGAATGATGAAADLVVPAAYSAAKTLIAKLRPGVENIAGEAIPVLASQRAGAAPIAAEMATTANTPEIAAAQQVGGQRAVTNIAQRATKDALDKVNEVRARVQPITDPSRLLSAPDDAKPFQFTLDGPPVEERVEGEIAPDARKKQIGTQVVAGKGPSGLHGDPFATEYAAGNFMYGDGEPLPQVSDRGDQPAGSHKEPAFQYLTGAKPGEGEGAKDVVGGGGRLVMTNPQDAQAALSHLQDVIDNSSLYEKLPKEQQQLIKASRDSLQQQLGMYHAADAIKPHFDPVDIGGAVQRVNSFGDAADQVQASVKPIYQKLDEVSGGEFTALRNQSKAASKVMFQPGSIDAYEKALDAKQAADQGIDDIFTKHSGDISRGEYQSAKSAWRDSVVLDNLHGAVEGAFKGAPQNIADSTGTNRLLRGNTMGSRLNRLLQKTPQADIERVIGRDGLENLYRVSDLLSKPETAIATQNVAKEVARHLTRRIGKGALIGGLIGHVLGPVGVAGGAVAGALSEDAGRYVLRQAAINPRVGVLVDRAVRHQVSPQIFAPLIAAAMRPNTTTEEGETQP